MTALAAAVTSDERRDDRDVLGTLFAVAWLATVAAVGVEAALFAVIVTVGTTPGIGAIAADLAQKITWGLLVCAGITLGTVVTRVRGEFIGLAGLFAAPLAFFAAKVAHKAATQSLGLAQVAPDVVDPLLAAGLKAVEYALLGAVLAHVATRGGRSLRLHVAVGAGFGSAFAALVMVLVQTSAPALPMTMVVVRGANELLAPIACSMVLFAANVLGRTSP